MKDGPVADKDKTNHALKCWPEFFQEIMEGRKTHDLRRHDRKYKVGDIIALKEFDPWLDQFTGRIQFVRVTYMTSGDSPCAYSAIGLQPGFCILSITTKLGDE